MPNVEIVAIGDEILRGAVLNTNAAFISEELSSMGIDVSSHVVVGDNIKEIKEVIGFSLDNFDLTIITGGLGAKANNLVNLALVDVLDTKLVIDKTILSKLKDNNSANLSEECLTDLAKIPNGCVPILDSQTSSYGLFFLTEDNMVVLLPGKPFEAKYIFNNRVKKLIKTNYKIEQNVIMKSLHLANVNLDTLEYDIEKTKSQYPRIDFSLYPHYGISSLHMKLMSNPTSFEISCFNDATNKIRNKYLSNTFSETTHNLSQVVLDLCYEKNINISIVQDAPNISFCRKMSSCPELNITVSASEFSGDGLRYRFKITKVNALSDVAIFISRTIKLLYQTDIGISIIHKKIDSDTIEITYCFYMSSSNNIVGTVPIELQPKGKFASDTIANYILFQFYRYLQNLPK